MKLDNDLQSPLCKSYNPFDSDDDPLETPGMKAANGLKKDSYDGFDLKAFEKDGDRLSFHVNNGDFSWEEAILGHSAIVDDAINADVNVDKSLFQKEIEFYTDKNVTQCDLPEFIVCFKESSYQSVKDIGIDEGVPSKDKMWVENREEYNKDPSAFLDLGSKNNGNFDILRGNHELPILEQVESTENDFHKDASIQCFNEGSSRKDGLNLEALAQQNSAAQLATCDSLKVSEATDDSAENDSAKGQSPTAAEMKTGDFVCVVAVIDSYTGNVSEKDARNSCESHLISRDELNLDAAGAEQDDASEKCVADNIPLVQSFHSEESLLQPSISDGREAEIKFSENPNKGASLPPSKASELEEVSDSSNAMGLLHNSKVEPGSITFSFNSSDTGKEEEKTQNAEYEKPPLTQIMTRHEDGSSSSNADSRFDRCFHGETSFSAVVIPPSSITYSGPIAYSGSISLRSESSAGSTRSFAFPILQTEWNSSPVRMAKADQRQFQKQKGWIRSLICCRF
ncbi:hypothetical protein Ancab_020932 [Ancistrocladus abbreviatus]